MNKKMKGVMVLCAIVVATTIAGNLNAATIGFYFNESNNMIDLDPSGDTFYGEVVLESNAPNEITITVNPFTSPGENDYLGNFINSPLVEGPNFGVQAFMMNSTLIDDEDDFDTFVAVYDIVVPASWTYTYGNNADGFGWFEFDFEGSSNRQDPLVIDISPKSGADVTGYEINSVNDFIELNEKGYLFAAHIAGFTVDSSYWENEENIESSWFAVPEPTTMTLLVFGSLALLRKRKK